jgi:hypothetical protein
MSVRFSSWFASAVQLREILFSTEDRRAEFVGSAPSFLYFAALALHCSTESIFHLPRWPTALWATAYCAAARLAQIKFFPLRGKRNRPTLGFGRFACGNRVGMPFADAALRECAPVMTCLCGTQCRGSDRVR